MSSLPLLSLLVFLPWVGAAALALLPRMPENFQRRLALAASLSTLAFTLALLDGFNPARTAPQFVERHAWIGAFNVHYHLGLDGLSLILVLLTGLVAPAALCAGFRSIRGVRGFAAFFLTLQGAAIGVFLALDFFHWFIFWELSLIPAYFLIKIWGGPGATRAAYQFVIYTIGGSSFMLLGFASLFHAAGTFDFQQLAQLGANGSLARKLGGDGSWWPQVVFLGVLLGLAVKVPLWPFHTWLPPAYAEAPAGASMFLTGVMSKMGVYGFLRILWPIFPRELQAAAPWLMILALGGVVLGAWAAMRQTDLKRMVAYSSVNHLSYCLLALFAVAQANRGAGAASEAATAALGGILLQMFNHGISAAALFLCVGVLEESSGGRRGVDDFGGVRTVAPFFAALTGVAMFSSLGLPGLNGFIGEFLIFRGVFGLAPWAAAIAALGLLATAIVLLTFWQRVFHGPVAGATPAFKDLTLTESAPLLPATILMVLLGVYPQFLAGLINPLVTAWAGHLTPP